MRARESNEKSKENSSERWVWNWSSSKEKGRLRSTRRSTTRHFDFTVNWSMKEPIGLDFIQRSHLNSALLRLFSHSNKFSSLFLPNMLKKSMKCLKFKLNTEPSSLLTKAMSPHIHKGKFPLTISMVVQAEALSRIEVSPNDGKSFNKIVGAQPSDNDPTSKKCSNNSKNGDFCCILQKLITKASSRSKLQPSVTSKSISSCKWWLKLETTNIQ